MTTPQWSGAAPAALTACPRCGTALGPDDQFCGHCGTWTRSGYAHPPYPLPPPPPPPGEWSSTGLPIAGWWSRVGSVVIDYLLLSVPAVAVTTVVSVLSGSTQVGVDSGTSTGGDEGIGWVAVTFVLLLAIQGAYFTWFNGLGRAQTIGNRATRITVRDARTGQPVGWPRALLRWYARLALYLFAVVPGLVSDLWPLWDRDNRTLADRIAGTIVMRLP